MLRGLNRKYIALLLPVLLVANLSCGSREKQLEDVAKDWCLTLRASQVIPVYPLSEDIRPGDVFLVELPVHRQAELYKRKGFLSLDRHVTRLEKVNFAKFYQPAYFDEGFQSVPHPRGQRVGATSGGIMDVNAPRAAFPSYTFEISESSGLNLALPLKGLMLGFGFMKTREAQGSISLTDTFTYGVSGDDLIVRLHKWFNNVPEAREMLTNIRRAAGCEIFLRVVSRVYLVGGVDVSLSNTGQFGANANAEPRNGMQGAELLNQAASLTVPAGNVTFSNATGRSVSLHESFQHPLVIGYIGFDVPITLSGQLGPPVVTLSQLQGETQSRDFSIADQSQTGEKQ